MLSFLFENKVLFVENYGFYFPDGLNGTNACGTTDDIGVPPDGGDEGETPARNWLDDVSLDRARIVNSQNDRSQTSSSSARPPGQA